jgi:hypothetical protein
VHFRWSWTQPCKGGLRVVDNKYNQSDQAQREQLVIQVETKPFREIE